MAEEWPRKELPGTAHTRPEAGPAIRREVRGARAGCGEEDARGPQPGERRAERVLCALCRAPAATARAAAAPHATVRPDGGHPRPPTPLPAPAPPSVGGLRVPPGRLEVGLEAIFVTRIEALLEVPSPKAREGPAFPENPPLERLFGGIAWRGGEVLSSTFIGYVNSEDIPNVPGKGPGRSR